MPVLEALVELLIILVAAKVGAEVMVRLRQPAVIGELIIGVIVGTSVLGWVEVGGNQIVSALAELGVIVLLFQVGLEIQMRDLLRLGRLAVSVAVIGVVAPFAFGYVASQALGLGGGSVEVALFIGAAMTATSVGITARVFSDLGLMDGDEARVVVGAAVVDDIIGLVILAVVAGVLGGTGELVGTELLGIGLRVLVFLVVSVGLGTLLMPRLLRVLSLLRVPGSYIVGALVVAVGLGIAAETLAGLDPIVGAFVAGLIVGQVDHIERIGTEMGPIGHLLIPIFFVSVGAQVDVAVLADSAVIVSGLVLTVLAVIGKVVSGFGVWGTRLRRLVIGVGMIPRGEVGLIFAALGASQLSTVVGAQEVAIVVLIVVLTTLGAPLALERILRRPSAVPTGPLEAD